MRTTILLLGLACCGSSGSERAATPNFAPRETCAGAAKGSPTDMHAIAHDGFAFGARETCGTGTYMKVEREHGRRRLGTGRGAGGGFDEGCAPGIGACDVINVGKLVDMTTKELNLDGVNAFTNGLGPCGDSDGDYAAWNYTFAVNDWHEADAAIAKLEALFDRYDIKGYVGVSVVSIPCGRML